MASTYSEEQRDVFLAKVAKDDEHYDEILELMMKVTRLNLELTREERTLLNKSMKQVIKNGRSSLEMLSPRATSLIRKMESELSKICYDMINLIDDHLLPSSSSTESIVFYYNLKGDCNRYLAEFKTGGIERTKAINNALEAYNKGSDIAKVELTPKNHVRLGLALNLSVLYYDIMKLPIKAINHAREAMDEADEDIGSLTMEEYEDSFVVMSVLLSNIFLWDSVMQQRH